VRADDDPVNRLLRGVEVPAAPPELRTLSLQRARVALARGRGSDSWRRVWENRRLRWAWAVAVAALVVANLALPGRRGQREPAGRDVVDAASTAVDRELASVVALPRIDSRHLQEDMPNTRQGLEPSPAGDSKRKENRS